MKQLFLILVFCIAAFYSNAQLGIIQDDPDVYVNLRDKPDMSGKIIMKLTAADVFYSFGPEGDWWSAEVYVKDAEHLVSGYIHKSRVKFTNEYDSICLNQISNDKIVFKNKNILVEVKTKAFDAKTNTVEYTNNDTKYNGYNVKTINHKQVWGIDGGIPNLAYDYILVTIDGKKIPLPAEAYDNLFQPTFNNAMNVYYDKQKDILYIQGMNSDGAGAYVFLIVIKNKKFEKTVAMKPF